jgi:hypothetical protein
MGRKPGSRPKRRNPGTCTECPQRATHQMVLPVGQSERKLLCKDCRDRYKWIQKNVEQHRGEYPDEHLDVFKDARFTKL